MRARLRQYCSVETGLMKPQFVNHVGQAPPIEENKQPREEDTLSIIEGTPMIT